MPLKYLFSALYADGTCYEQGYDDQSVQDPRRNAFFDIHYQPFKPEEELVTFALHEVGGSHTYTVDLRDGHFEVDEIPFRMWEGAVQGCRLVFWKRHTHAFNQALEEQEHEIVYRIGWQALINGENIQRVLEVD
jgi:hypothetical protein